MIDLAILFAILSLMLGGLNEVVFKRYSARERSRGMMISGIGVVWILLLACDIALRGDSIEIDRAGLGYGLVAGLIVAVANILLLESLKHMGVSLGSTIYRLNTVGVVILSIVFLGEIMTLPKLSGIVCAVVAVLLLYRHQSSQLQQGELKLGLTLVLIGAICRAVYAVVTKAGLGAGVDMDLLLLTSALCWVLSGLIYARFIERRYAITRQKSAYSRSSGCLGYGILRTLRAARCRLHPDRNH